MRFAVAALVVLAGCQNAPERDSLACTLPAAQVLEQSGDPHGPDGRLLQVWDVAADPVLWSDASPKGSYADFVAQVAERGLETDPVTLLRRAPPSPNNAIVIAHADEWIRPAGCLEKLLTGYQHARIDTFVAPTEFASVVMRAPDGGRLRIYYYTINQDGIGRASPLLDPAHSDAARGWTMELVLHPHVFHPGQPALDGLVGPSVPDAGLAYNLLEAGLKHSWITNGIHTVRMPASAFGLFTRE